MCACIADLSIYTTTQLETYSTTTQYDVYMQTPKISGMHAIQINIKYWVSYRRKSTHNQPGVIPTVKSREGRRGGKGAHPRRKTTLSKNDDA